jgi:hypothetical protein
MNSEEVFNQWAIAQWQFPGANVYASTYDNFITQLNTVRSTLPVTTAEAGDTWVTSTTADANKMIFYREASRAYAECLANNQCDIHDPRVLGFTRMLAKIPEHVSISSHIILPFPFIISNSCTIQPFFYTILDIWAPWNE